MDLERSMNTDHETPACRQSRAVSGTSVYSRGVPLQCVVNGEQGEHLETGGLDMKLEVRFWRGLAIDRSRAVFSFAGALISRRALAQSR